MKRIIIGGSSSTGSSLLNNVLGRNSSIYTTVETSLFCKRALFDDFNKNKWKISFKFPFGLKNYGHHLYRKTDLGLISGLAAHDIKDGITKYENFQEFADYIFGNCKKEVWIEKTPGNSCNFDLFLDAFQDSFVIHTIRNPYDALTSMLLRGFSDAYAAGIYLLNTLCALKNSGHDRYIEIRYESLTNDPEKTIRELLDKIGIQYEGSELLPQNEKIDFANISTWNKDETGHIEPNINRFENAPVLVRERVVDIIEGLKVSVKGASFYGVPDIGFRDLVEELGYAIKNQGGSNSKNKIKSSLVTDRLLRLRKMYFSHYYHYPLEIII